MFSPNQFGIPDYLTVPAFVIAWIVMPLFIRRAAFAVLNGERPDFEKLQPGNLLLAWRTVAALVAFGVLGSVGYLILSTLIGSQVPDNLRAAYIVLLIVLCTPITLAYLVLIQFSCTSIVAGNQVRIAVSEAIYLIRRHFQLLIKVALFCFLPFYSSLYVYAMILLSSGGYENQAGQIISTELAFLPPVWFAMGAIVQVIFVCAYQQLSQRKR
ncbi:MAG: hypothetical protein KIT08_06830 [Anaerolineales bacterium]|nr:MAG: hypothetical protein KIT08_06830 [Anaerolineales bacterium]